MQINTFVIIERAVYEGVALGLSQAMHQQTEGQTAGQPLNPEQIVGTIHNAVMNELGLIIEFNQQQVAVTEEFDQLAANQQKQHGTNPNKNERV